MYLAFFVIVGAAAYGLILTTSAPHVELDGPTHSQGDTVELGERTWTVSSIEVSTGGGGGGGHGGGGGGEISRSGELSWTNESDVVSTSLDNGTTVPPTDVVWADQTARDEATFAGGDTVEYNGSQHEVSVNATAGTLTLADADDPTVNTSLSVGDTFEYQNSEATVTDIAAGEATVVRGNSYLLLARNANVAGENITDPTEMTFVEQRNVTELAVEDPALYDEPVRQNGVLKVTYRANDTNVPVDEYFGPAETRTFAEGDTLQYQGNETTVEAVDNESVTLTRPGETTTTIELQEGANVTVGDQQYFAHFPDNSSVQVFSTDERYGEYHAQNAEIDNFHERKNGLWGVVDLSIIAAILLVATALLPVKG